MADRKPPIMKAYTVEDFQRDQRALNPQGEMREGQGPITNEPLSEELLARVRTFPELLAALNVLPSLDSASPGGSTQAVTQFLWRQAPDKAARMLATEDFLQQALRLLPKSAQEPVRAFVERFPRAAAHMQLGKLTGSIPPPVPGMSPSQGITLPKGTLGDPRKFGVNLDLKQLKTPDDIERVLTHEATHVAQSLGNRDMDALYNLASRGIGTMKGPVQGYRQNPFELSAETVARRKLGSAEDPVQAIQRLLNTPLPLQDKAMLNAIMKQRGTTVRRPPAPPTRKSTPTPTRSSTRRRKP